MFNFISCHKNPNRPGTPSPKAMSFKVQKSETVENLKVTHKYKSDKMHDKKFEKN